MSKNSRIKGGVDKYLGVETSEIQRKKTAEDIEQLNFVKLITKLEEIHLRTLDMIDVYKINFKEYNQPFQDVINIQLEMLYPDSDIRTLIYFYVYERYTLEGEIIPIVVNDTDYILSSPIQLYAMIKYIKTL